MKIRGFFRTFDPLLGRCVVVHDSAGDAAPLLSEAIYDSLGGKPPINQLPTKGPISQNMWERAIESCTRMPAA